jgi:hypothetical protein
VQDGRRAGRGRRARPADVREEALVMRALAGWCAEVAVVCGVVSDMGTAGRCLVLTRSWQHSPVVSVA